MKRKTVFKKVSVLALALAMGVNAPEAFVALPVLAVEETAEKTNIQIEDLAAKTGLKKVELSFSLPEGADSTWTYTVYRGTKMDALSAVGTAEVSGTIGSYTDTDDVTNKLYFYQIKAENENTSVTSNVTYSQTAAGMDSIANVLFFKDVSNVEFDGNTTVDLSQEEINVFKDLDAPTIFIKSAPNSDVAHTQVQFMAKTQGAEGGNDNRLYTQLTWNAGNSKYKPWFVWPQAIAYGAADANIYLPGAESSTIAIGYTKEGTIAFGIDGSTDMRFTRGKTGFANITNLNEFTIGGWHSGNTTAVSNGFEGTISYIAITDEELSQAEMLSLQGYTAPSKDYAIHFNTDGAAAMNDVSEHRDASAAVLTIPETAPEKENYTFIGWSANGLTYAPGEKVILLADSPELSLTALYTEAKPDPVEPDPVVLPTLSALGRYEEAILSISREETDNTEYEILRSESENGEYVKAGTLAASESSFVDSGLDSSKTYFYKLKSAEGESKDPVSLKSDKAAYIQNAEATKKVDSSVVFDGNKVLNMNEHVDKVKNLSGGSVIIRFKADDASVERYAFAASSSAAAVSGGLNSASNVVLIGHDGGGKPRANVNALRGAAGSSLNDGQWHTAVITSATENGYDLYLAVDGKEIFSYNDISSTNAKAFLSGINGLDRLEIGGYTAANGTVLNGFKGQIDYVSISSQKLTKAQAKAVSIDESHPGVLANLQEDMFGSQIGNTWLFVGGTETEGAFDQIHDTRNYSAQFEEYIRWTRGSTSEITKMRYVTNAAAKGNTLETVLTKLDKQLAAVHPRAVAYMAGSEDIASYLAAEDKTAWLTSYKSHLQALYDASVQTDSDSKFLVLQTPHARTDANSQTAAQAIANAMSEFKESLTTSQKSHLVVVDHFTQTNTDSFKSTYLKNDELNGHGQYLIGKQLSAATIGSDGFNWSESNLDENPVKDVPDYLATDSDALQADFSTQNGLQITLAGSDVLGSESWSVQAVSEDLTLRADAKAGQTITLPASEGDWTVSLISADKTKQTASYTISKGEQAAKKVSPTLPESEKSAKQKEISNLLKSDNPLTWLFIGDSITHGALHTKGSDSITQNFQKYLDAPDGLNRPDDLVINTAVSGARASDTLNSYLDGRVKDYTADVAIFMLGMNDSGTATDTYVSQMQALIDAVKEKNPNAILVLRICNTVPGRADVSNANDDYPVALRGLAQKNNAILVDHATTWDYYRARVGTTASGGAANFNNNNLHPNGIGQRVMFDDLVKAMGLYDESSPYCRYGYTLSTSQNASKPSVTSPEIGKVNVRLTSLMDASTIGLAEVTLTVDGVRYTKTYNRVTSTDTTVSFENLPVGKEAVVDVKISRSDNATRIVYAQSDPITVASQIEDYTASIDQAKGGYSNVTLHLSKPEGKEVKILRADSADGNFEELAVTSESTYLDRTVQPEKSYFYKLSWTDSTDHTTEPVSVDTGLAVYKANAEVYKALTNETFDGSKVVELSADEVEKVKNMPSGSIFFRVRTSELENLAIISGKAAADTADLFGTGGGTKNRSVIGLRAYNDKSVVRPDLSHTRADKPEQKNMADGEWHNVVLVSNPGATETFTVYLDGESIGFSFDGESNAGLLSKLTTMDQITIGGIKNPDGILGGFKGEIRDVVFSSEYFTADQGHALTEVRSSDIDPADDEVELTSVQGGYSNITLSIANENGASVSILRAESEDGPFTEVGTTNSTSYLDRTVLPEKTYFYKLAWTQSESHETEVKSVRTGMDVYTANAQVYKALKGEQFDGTKTVALSAAEVEKVKANASGSIFLRLKTSAVEDMILICGKSSSDTISSAYFNSSENAKRHNIGLRAYSNGNKTSFRPDYAYTRADNPDQVNMSDNEWHNVAIVSNPGDSSTCVLFVDGERIFSFNGAGNAGLMSRLAEMDQITIGGIANGDAVACGFEGAIRDVVFSSEAFTDDQGKAITAQRYSETDPDPDPEKPEHLDTFLLEMAIEKADRTAADIDQFKDDHKQAFQTARTQAAALLTRANAQNQAEEASDNDLTQTDIDAQARALCDALLALRKLPSANALSALPNVQ